MPILFCFFFLGLECPLLSQPAQAFPANKHHAPTTTIGRIERMSVATCNYTMDPDGDTILTLRSPSAPFLHGLDLFLKNHPTQSPLDASEELAAREGSVLLEADSVADQSPSKKAGLTGPSDSSESVGGTRTERTPRQAQTFTFRVSSRHLILASPIFKAALKGGWKEGSEINGEYHIDAEDWDVHALEIVMNAIHGHHRRISKTINQDTLAKIAIIVDYYQTYEILLPWSMVWVEQCRKESFGFKSGFSTFCRLTISFIFGDEEMFSKAVGLALLDSPGPLVCPNVLPIACIIGKSSPGSRVQDV